MKGEYLSLKAIPLSSRSASIRDLVFSPPAVGSLASTDVLQFLASADDLRRLASNVLWKTHFALYVISLLYF